MSHYAEHLEAESNKNEESNNEDPDSNQITKSNNEKPCEQSSLESKLKAEFKLLETEHTQPAQQESEEGSKRLKRRAFLKSAVAGLLCLLIYNSYTGSENSNAQDVAKPARRPEHIRRSEAYVEGKEYNARIDLFGIHLIYEYPADLDTLDAVLGSYALVIEKKTQRLEVYKKSQAAWIIEKQYPVSTSKIPGDKKRKGDGRTPSGVFRIMSIEPSANWRDPWTNSFAYGPYFMRLQGDWDRQGRYHPKRASSIGIHGTNEPENIGKRASHGCIRMLNQDLLEIKKNYVKIGTPVVIREELEKKKAEIHIPFYTPLCLFAF